MTIAAFVAGTPLRQGASGEAVKAIQLALKARGYPLSGTGYFGPATDTAVEDFQRKSGLPATGIVDDNTARALDMPAGEQVKPSVPLWLAVSLAHLGLKEGPGNADNKDLVADIKSVASDYQHDATPWCAGWVSFCLSKAGEKPSSQPLWALSYSDTKNQPFVRLAGPALGAIAVKTRNGGGHVTFVAGRTKGGALACCGGNQNDEVNVSPYREDVFVGFYWPKGVALPALTGLKNLPVVGSAGKPVASEA
jgi:uncharacterized protein (TIGR02594 family)